MSDPNATEPDDDEPRDRAETGTGTNEAPPTGDVMEAEDGGTQEPIDGP